MDYWQLDDIETEILETLSCLFSGVQLVLSKYQVTIIHTSERIQYMLLLHFGLYDRIFLFIIESGLFMAAPPLDVSVLLSPT